MRRWSAYGSSQQLLLSGQHKVPCEGQGSRGEVRRGGRSAAQCSAAGGVGSVAGKAANQARKLGAGSAHIAWLCCFKLVAGHGAAVCLEPLACVTPSARQKCRHARRLGHAPAPHTKRRHPHPNPTPSTSRQVPRGQGRLKFETEDTPQQQPAHRQGQHSMRTGLGARAAALVRTPPRDALSHTPRA